MSGVAQSVESDPETAVRKRSQYTQTLHRQDPDADEPAPACEGAYNERADYTEVSVAAYRPHYSLCKKPDCFGGEQQ